MKCMHVLFTSCTLVVLNVWGAQSQCPFSSQWTVGMSVTCWGVSAQDDKDFLESLMNSARDWRKQVWRFEIRL